VEKICEFVRMRETLHIVLCTSHVAHCISYVTRRTSHVACAAPHAPLRRCSWELEPLAPGRPPTPPFTFDGEVHEAQDGAGDDESGRLMRFSSCWLAA